MGGHIIINFQGFEGVRKRRLVIYSESRNDADDIKDDDIIIENAQNLRSWRDWETNASLKVLELLLRECIDQNRGSDPKYGLLIMLCGYIKTSCALVHLPGGQEFLNNHVEDGNRIDNTNQEISGYDKEAQDPFEITLTYISDRLLARSYTYIMTINGRTFTQKLCIARLPQGVGADDHLLEAIANASGGAVSSTDLHRVCKPLLSDGLLKYQADSALHIIDIMYNASVVASVISVFAIIGRAIVGYMKHENLVRAKAGDFGKNVGSTVALATFCTQLFFNWQSKKRVDSYLSNINEGREIELG